MGLSSTLSTLKDLHYKFVSSSKYFFTSRCFCCIIIFVMIKNLSPQEKQVLARILMPYIVRFLDNSDFGMRPNDDPRLNYVRPHLSLGSLDMLDKYLAKLSPSRRK